MKKIWCFLLVVRLLLNFSMNIYAETLPQPPVAGAKADVLKDPVQAEVTFVSVPNVPAGKATPLKKNTDNNKPGTVPEGEHKNVKSTELVEVIPDALEEYNPDAFDEDFDGEQGFSKTQLAKDIAVYMVKSFVHDLKSFVMFYPLIKTSSFITFCAWVFPLYFLYKKTGIDVPGMYSDFAMKHSNWHIFFMNLYNVIPMTLASFIFKYGQEAYFKFKTA